MDTNQWRREGQGIRRVESFLGTTPPATLAAVRKAVMFALTSKLQALDAADQETALGVAVEGYLAEHARRGGTITDG